MNEKRTLIIEMSFNICNNTITNRLTIFKAIKIKLTLVQIKQTNKYYIQ